MKNMKRTIAILLSVICILALASCKKKDPTKDIDEYRYPELEGYWVEKDADPKTGAIISFSYTDEKNIVVIMDNDLENTEISSRYSVSGNYLKLKPAYDKDVSSLGGMDGQVNIRFKFGENKQEITLDYADKTVSFEKFDKDLSVVPDRK